MKKIALIVLVLAATIGAGAFVYSKWKKVPHTDEEMIPPPVAEEKDPPKSTAHEPKEVEEEAPAPVAEKPKTKPKASSGHFEMAVPASAHDDADSADNPGFGKAREKRLRQIFKSDKDLARSVIIKDIRCRVDTCIIEAESKDGDAERFQSIMFALTKQYPWLGNKVDVTTPPDNPRVARFVYFHETPK